MENLKEIGGFPGYCVDNTGNVFSVKTDVMLKPWKINGYNAVGLYRSGKRYVFLVHRLVAAAFIPNPENKPCVDHIDGVRFHNFVENLRWCTQDENMNYELAIRNKTKYNFPIEGVGYDGKVCVEFLNYKDAQKKGFDRTQIKKAVDTGKPYKGIHYRIKTEK